MLFGSPVKGTLHIAKSAILCIVPGSAYVGRTAYWTRPAGNYDPAITQFFGPSGETLEPSRTWGGGEGIKAGYYPDFHNGTDFGFARCGDPVLAAGPGKVIAAGTDTDGAIFVKISHGQGFETWYWHLSKRLVSTGAVVVEGQGIGAVGSTGKYTTGCHLDWRVTKNGIPVDGYRRLKVNTSVDPDAPLPEADMVLTKNLWGYTCRVASGYNIRKAPALSGAVIRLTSAVETWTVLGVVKGDLANGSTEWYVRANGLTFEYVHAGAVSGLAAPAPASGHTDAEMAAAVLEGRRKEWDDCNAGIVVVDPPAPPATASLSNPRP